MRDVFCNLEGTIIARHINEDTVVILEPDHPDWEDALAKKPEPYVPPVADIILAFTKAVDAHVELTARNKGYNNAAALASYVESTVPLWKEESLTFISWRDKVWVQALNSLELIQGGATPPNSPEDFIKSLPSIVWPTTGV